jgi:N-formylglutamate amidohydrolase
MTFLLDEGDGPVIATAIHDGHVLRAEVAKLIALDETVRRREEDPFTSRLAAIVPTRLVARRSRFEVDLNRPRQQAVYARPEDAWGLAVWHEPLGDELIARSLSEYDAFYATLERVLRERERRYGRFVVLDLHSYNHRRDGADGPIADATANPEINVGTGSLDRARWGALVDRFCRELAAAAPVPDVRENVRFQGGHLSRWVHATFPETGCCLALEFKKTFMDEWSGAVDEARLAALTAALASTLPGLVEELAR